MSSRATWCLIYALTAVAIPGGTHALAQTNPTNVMTFCGYVTTLNGGRLNGVQITVSNQRTGQTETCPTPRIVGTSGTYAVVLQDMGNNAAAQAGDRVTFQVADPINRFRRVLQCNPSAITLSKGDTASMMKKLNLIVF